MHLLIFQQLIALIDRKTGKRGAQRPRYALLQCVCVCVSAGVDVIGVCRFVKQDQVVIARLQTAGVICLETFKEFPQMARFTLRDEGECNPFPHKLAESE